MREGGREGKFQREPCACVEAIIFGIIEISSGSEDSGNCGRVNIY